MSSELEMLHEGLGQKEPRIFHPIYSTMVLLLFVGCAFVPLLPLEISKWYIAAAENSVRVNAFEKTEENLKRASSIYPLSAELPEYRLVQCLMLTQSGRPDEAIQVLRALLAAGDSSGRALSYVLGDYFMNERDFGHALECLRESAKWTKSPSYSEKNTLAYARSLVGVELEEALRDIDSALVDRPEDPNLMDTKAWVLHRSQRHSEAKEWMKKALSIQVEKLKEMNAFVGLDPEDKLITDALREEGSKLSTEIAKIREQLRTIRKHLSKAQIRNSLSSLSLFHIAILRYHYAEICEADGDQEEADRQRDWLEWYGFTEEDELY